MGDNAISRVEAALSLKRRDLGFNRTLVNSDDLRELLSLARSIMRARAAVEAERREWFCSGDDCSLYDHGRDEGLKLAVEALDRLSPNLESE